MSRCTGIAASTRTRALGLPGKIVCTTTGLFDPVAAAPIMREASSSGWVRFVVPVE